MLVGHNKIHHLPEGTKVPEELFETPIEHIDIRPCADRDEPHPTTDIADSVVRCKRKSLRVDDDDIQAWFLIGVGRERQPLFSRLRWWRLVNRHKPDRYRRLARLNWCDVINISVGGIYIEAVAGLKLNDTLVLYLSDLTQPDSVECPLVGNVKHIEKISRRVNRYGIAFSSMPQRDLRDAIYAKTIPEKSRFANGEATLAALKGNGTVASGEKPERMRGISLTHEPLDASITCRHRIRDRCLMPRGHL